MRRILPEIFLRGFSRLGGEEALRQPGFLRNGGDAIAVGIIRTEENAILAEGSFGQSYAGLPYEKSGIGSPCWVT